MVFQIVLVLCSILFSTVQCFVISDLNRLQILKITEDDIRFYYCNRSSSFQILVNVSNPKQVNASGFSPEKDTFFYFHGYDDDGGPGQAVKSALLEKYDVNLFMFDYTRIDDCFYPVIVDQVESIGKIIAVQIQRLVKNNNLNLDRTTFVCASLGGHIAGATGNYLGGKVARILALDPASPFYSIENSSNRLNRTGGKYVQVMHTGGAKIGLDGAIGHADYYVNGGRTQSACFLDVSGKCAHVIGHYYYAETILGSKLWARKCNNYTDFKAGKCSSNQLSWLGSYELDTKASGTYYLDTHICSSA